MITITACVALIIWHNQPTSTGKTTEELSTIPISFNVDHSAADVIIGNLVQLPDLRPSVPNAPSFHMTASIAIVPMSRHRQKTIKGGFRSLPLDNLQLF